MDSLRRKLIGHDTKPVIIEFDRAKITVPVVGDGLDGRECYTTQPFSAHAISGVYDLEEARREALQGETPPEKSVA